MLRREIKKRRIGSAVLNVSPKKGDICEKTSRRRRIRPGGTSGGIGVQVGPTATAKALRQELYRSVCLKRNEPGVEL